MCDFEKMGLAIDASKVEKWEDLGKGGEAKKKNKKMMTMTVADHMAEESSGCWVKLRFMAGGCMSSRSKVDTSPCGSKLNSFTAAVFESKSRNEKTMDSPAAAMASSTTSNAESTSSTPKFSQELKVASQLRKFTFNELKSATRNFRPESLLGEGGFGCVFKGWIEENGTAPVKPGTGLTVAVKTLNHDGVQGHKEWLAEVNLLGDLVHPHLVELIGCCIEDDQRLLVYEFMLRGSLENHLFRRSLPLPWSIRMKIALGAAKGLAFLHEGVKRPIIYRDFKTSNILLDADYNAKLSDFGLAKDGPEGDKSHVSTRVMGTYGYAAPEYVMTGHLTTKSDVYSFGVVLLELITGRRSIDKKRPNGEQSLVEWARPLFANKRMFDRLIDARLEGHFSIKGAQKAIELASHCLSCNPKARPLMSEAVETLKPLPGLRDMATSAHYLHNVQGDRQKFSPGLKNGVRSQSMFVSRNGHHVRTLSSLDDSRASPFRPRRHPSPKSKGKDS